MFFFNDLMMVAELKIPVATFSVNQFLVVLKIMNLII